MHIVDEVRTDVVFALRTLRRAPLPGAAIVLSLGFGMAAVTIMFSLVSAVLLRPLPFKNGGQIVWIWSMDVKRSLQQWASYPDFRDWSAASTSFDELAGWGGFEPVLSGAGDPERLQGALATANLLDLLGVPALIGSASPSANDPANMAVISHGLWQRRFASDSGIVGQTIVLNGQRFTVKGVMPRRFQFPIRANPIDVWILLRDDQFNPALRNRREARLIEVVGRLRSGVSADQAQREMDAIAQALSARYPKTNTDVGIRVVPGIQQTVGGTSNILWLLFAAVGCILLLACVNVANVLLVRTVRRQHEIAVRAALGAARGRLWRQLLVEGLVLWSAGGVFGALLAAWGVQALAAILPGDLPRIDEIGMDFRVMAFAATVSALTGVGFSLMPASIGAKVNVTESLQQSARTASAGVRTRRLSDLLAAGEIAFALVLMTGAVLFMTSFIRLSAPVSGFDPTNVLTFELSWPTGQYTRARAAQAFEALQAKLLDIPGVRAASVGIQLPDRGGPLLDDVLPVVQPAGYVAQAAEIRTAILPILPGYFRATGIPITRGRDFNASDQSQAPHVVVINETLARVLFQGQDPVGRQLRMSAWTFPDRVPEIVGVARDVKHSGLIVDSSPLVYLPLPQYPVNVATMVVKTDEDPQAVVGAVRAAVASIDPDQPIYDIRPLERRLAESFALDRFRALLMTLFAGIGAMLAASGLFAVLSYTVAQRTHEFGIRMALGAGRSDVLRLVLRQGMTTAFAGLGAGIITALSLARFASALLYGMDAAHPRALVAASAMLLLVALLACIIPALRATRVDPVVALE